MTAASVWVYFLFPKRTKDKFFGLAMPCILIALLVLIPRYFLLLALGFVFELQDLLSDPISVLLFEASVLSVLSVWIPGLDIAQQDYYVGVWGR